MQLDFHYYATYCAAYLAGYAHTEALAIAYSDQFCDCCSRTLLSKLNAPKNAATTQVKTELMNNETTFWGMQNITQIWASFHFLPKNLYAKRQRRPKIYMNKYRLICGPNGPLVKETVELARDSSLQAVGIAMHVLSDTWAHRYYAGTPSNVINDTSRLFYEIVNEDGAEQERLISWKHSPVPDNPETSYYTCSIDQELEQSIMNLGHGRIGHLPDYSYIRYKYMPAWDDYRYVIKDNPDDYYHAFCQMIYAMKYLRGEIPEFVPDTYEEETAAPYREEIMQILRKRQLIASADWKAFAEKLSGNTIEDFDVSKYQEEYRQASEDKKRKTFLGKFFLASILHKGMVTHEIFMSGNTLAGIPSTFRLTDLRKPEDVGRMIQRFLGD